MAKESGSKPITTNMGPYISSTKKGSSTDMAKAPRKMAKGEVSNEVPRPHKR